MLCAKFPNNFTAKMDVMAEWDCSTFKFNSSPPSATYLRQWTDSVLVQIMACRLFGAKPLSEPMLDYSQLNPRNKLQWNFNQNTIFFIDGNAFQKVACEMAAILSRGRWVTRVEVRHILQCLVHDFVTWNVGGDNRKNFLGSLIFLISVELIQHYLHAKYE